MVYIAPIMKINRKKFPLFAGSLFVLVALISLFTQSVIVSKNTNEKTIHQTDKQESEVLGTNEQEDNADESLTPTQTPEVLAGEADEENVLPTSSENSVPSSQGTTSPPTSNTVVVAKVTSSPTSVPESTPTTQPENTTTTPAVTYRCWSGDGIQTNIVTRNEPCHDGEIDVTFAPIPTTKPSGGGVTCTIGQTC